MSSDHSPGSDDSSYFVKWTFHIAMAIRRGRKCKNVFKVKKKKKQEDLVSNFLTFLFSVKCDDTRSSGRTLTRRTTISISISFSITSLGVNSSM